MLKAGHRHHMTAITEELGLFQQGGKGIGPERWPGNTKKVTDDRGISRQDVDLRRLERAQGLQRLWGVGDERGLEIADQSNDIALRIQFFDTDEVIEATVTGRPFDHGTAMLWPDLDAVDLVGKIEQDLDTEASHLKAADVDVVY